MDMLGRRRSSRLALLGQPRSPLLCGEDPSSPHGPRLWGLDPIGSKPHRRGLRIEVRLTPLRSCLGFEIPIQLRTRGLVHAHEGPGRVTAQDLRQRDLGEPKRDTEEKEMSPKSGRQRVFASTQWQALGRS